MAARSRSATAFSVFQGSSPAIRAPAPVQRKYIEKLPPPVFLTAQQHVQQCKSQFSGSLARGARAQHDPRRPDGTFRPAPPIRPPGAPTRRSTSTPPELPGERHRHGFGRSPTGRNSYSFVGAGPGDPPSQYFDKPAMAVSAASGISNPKPLSAYLQRPIAVSRRSPVALYTAPFGDHEPQPRWTWLATRSGYSPANCSPTRTHPCRRWP